MSDTLRLFLRMVDAGLVDKSVGDMDWFAEIMPKAASMVLATESHNIDHKNLSAEHHHLLDFMTSIMPIHSDPIPILYRCQIGVSTTLPNIPDIFVNPMGVMEVQTPQLSQSGRKPLSESRMTPNSNFVKSGRINADGEAVLYAATDISTAILENRCPLGSAITVSEVFMNTEKTLKIADLRVMQSSLSSDPETRLRQNTLVELTYLFSSRLVGESGREAYKVSQLVGKYLRYKQFDGVLYSSSQSDSGDNYAFFDPLTMRVQNSVMKEVTGLKIEFEDLIETNIVKPIVLQP